MNIEEMTIGEARELSKLFNNQSQVKPLEESPFKVGKTYLIRTVTMTWYGTVKLFSERFITLKEASWIADTGKFSEALKDAQNFDSVEPAQTDVIIAIGAIVDATEMAVTKLSVK